MLEAAVPERSSALSICMVMRLKRLGRGSCLAVVALSSIGREFEVLAVLTSGWASADVVTSPAVVCARGIARRVGADMVFCDKVCVTALASTFKNGVDEDDGSGVEAVAIRLERSVLVDCMFSECVVCICQGRWTIFVHELELALCLQRARRLVTGRPEVNCTLGSRPTKPH
jgi:hypothetical protein